MRQEIIDAPFFDSNKAKSVLALSAKSLITVALIGQWAFAFYILVIYTFTLVNGLNPIDFSPAPNVKTSDSFDRGMFFAHVIPAIYLSMFGIMQLVPAIRNRYRAFHRFNGRVFLALGFSGALTGLYLQWSKGAEVNVSASLGITINGLLILVAAFYAWFYAVKKRFDLHMRWAVHSFILINGVWSFRLYLMGWYIVNQGSNGNTQHLDGPMDIFLAFACYLLPMLLTEVYFWAKKQRSSSKVWLGAVAMTGGVIITLIGAVSAVMAMWTPRITQVFGAL